MQFFRRLNHQQEMWVKLGGAIGFVVVIASLYFFLLSGMLSGNAATGATLQTTPLQFAGGTSPTSTVGSTPISPVPPVSPTPPLLPPRYQVTTHLNLNYRSAGALDQQLDLCEP